MVAVHTVNTVSLEHSDVPCMFLLIEGSVYINTFCYLSQLTVMKQLTVNNLFSWFVAQSGRKCKMFGMVGLK